MFDPYHKWLGIPPAQQPPTHYRLLGLELFESDPEVIEAAANQRMAYLQEVAGGDHIRESQKLLNEVATARRCLLNASKKAEYDATLRTSPSPPTSPTDEINDAFIPPPVSPPRTPPKPANKPPRSNRWWFIGGGIAIGGMLLIGVVVLLVANSGTTTPTKPTTVAKGDSPKKDDPEPLPKETPKGQPKETPKVNPAPTAPRTERKLHFAPQQPLSELTSIVRLDRDYHLFYQLIPTPGVADRWGHAVSRDLLNWQDKPTKHPTSVPTAARLCTVVVDSANTSGFGTNKNPPLLAYSTIYVPARTESKTSESVDVFLSYSTDLGNTWTGYAKNPVHKIPPHTDARLQVVRHEASKQWIMLAARPSPNGKAPDGELKWLISKNGTTWTSQSDSKIPFGTDAPDFLEVPIQGDPTKTKGVLVAGNGQYQVGQYDGKTFSKEGNFGSPTLRNQSHPASCTIVVNNAPRVLQFVQLNPTQGKLAVVSLPHELRMVNQKDAAWRLLRAMPKERDGLRDKEQAWNNVNIGKGTKGLDFVKGQVFEFQLELEKQNANEVVLTIAGEKLRYAFDKKRWFGEGYEIPTGDGKTIRLHGYVDHDVVELDFGTYPGTFARVRTAANPPLELTATNGNVKVTSLRVHPLRLPKSPLVALLP